MNSEFGRLSTTSDLINHALLLEIRKNNELLQKLVDKSAPKAATPVKAEKKEG